MKVSTGFHAHPRIVSVSLGASGLYVLAAGYSQTHKLLGEFPEAALRLFHGPRRDLKELLTVELVRKAPGGYSRARWKEPRETDRWLLLGHTDDPNPLLAIATGRAAELAARRGRISRAVRDAVMARDEGICGICREPVELADIHLDHILPVSLGGLSEIDNLQVTHATCNLRKGARV